METTITVIYINTVTTTEKNFLNGSTDAEKSVLDVRMDSGLTNGINVNKIQTTVLLLKILLESVLNVMIASN